jgi:hypothetical protein
LVTESTRTSIRAPAVTLGHVGLQLQHRGILDVHQRFAGDREVADIDPLFGDESGERGGDLHVTQHRFRFGDRRARAPQPGIRRVQFGLRGALLFEQRGNALVIALRLVQAGRRLVQPRPNLLRLKPRDQLARFNPLPEFDRERLNASTHLRLQRGVLAGPDGADDLFSDGPHFALNGLDTHGGGWEGSGVARRARVFAATGKRCRSRRGGHCPKVESQVHSVPGG